jgi:hypothetical protein
VQIDVINRGGIHQRRVESLAGFMKGARTLARTDIVELNVELFEDATLFAEHCYGLCRGVVGPGIGSDADLNANIRVVHDDLRL